MRKRIEKRERFGQKKRKDVEIFSLFLFGCELPVRAPFGRCVYDKRILQSGKGADRFLHVGKESRKMPAVRHGVVDVHRKGQHAPAVFRFEFSPGDHGGEIGAAVEYVDIETFIFHPRQAGNVERVRRRRKIECAEIFIFFPVRKETRVKQKEIFGVFGGKFHEVAVFLVEIRIKRGNGVPADQISAGIAAVPEFGAGVYRF